ncbi:MAG TPA: HAMP domain-containing sensor histidine kinase [Labilithrix sp.]
MPRSRLALTIYLIGIVQFVVVAFGVDMHRRAQRTQTTAFELEGRYVADTIGHASDLGAEVDRTSTMLGWSIVVRGEGGKVLAQSDHLRAVDGRLVRRTFPIALTNGAPAELEYSVVRRQPPSNFVLISLVLVVVGVSSWLTARALTRPLSRVVSAANAFGDGDLEARARMTRRDEIGDLGRAFDSMADRVARLLLAERELLANVSHELRTPLARIRVALDLAHEAESEPRQALESIHEIAEDLAELERIVDDTLAAARIAFEDGPRSSPGLTLRRELVDTRALLDRAVVKFRAMHPKRELDVFVDDELPTIHGDAVLIRRVVDNLLDNAHKYTDDVAAHIVIAARRDGDQLLVEVEDRGVGIAPDDVDRLCEPFFRSDRSRTRATGGFGLGLALARGVVDAHGGTLEFKSTLGVGTTARVRLPAA